MQRFPLEEHRGEHREHDERDDLLDNLQLHQRERPPVARETDTVGRYLECVLRQRDAPREQYHRVQRPIRADFHFLQLQVTVPRERHEDVRHDQQQDGR